MNYDEATVKKLVMLIAFCVIGIGVIVEFLLTH